MIGRGSFFATDEDLQGRNVLHIDPIATCSLETVHFFTNVLCLWSFIRVSCEAVYILFLLRAPMTYMSCGILMWYRLYHISWWSSKWPVM